MAQPWGRRLTVVGGATLVLVLLAVAGSPACAGGRSATARTSNGRWRSAGLTQRYSWTDWAAVRSELEADLDADTSATRSGLPGQGFDAD